MRTGEFQLGQNRLDKGLGTNLLAVHVPWYLTACRCKDAEKGVRASNGCLSTVKPYLPTQAVRDLYSPIYREGRRDKLSHS
jgi:hypothetical protein